MALTLTPITLREANAYVEQYHRHHPPAREESENPEPAAQPARRGRGQGGLSLE